MANPSTRRSSNCTTRTFTKYLLRRSSMKKLKILRLASTLSRRWRLHGRRASKRQRTSNPKWRPTKLTLLRSSRRDIATSNVIKHRTRLERTSLKITWTPKRQKRWHRSAKRPRITMRRPIRIQRQFICRRFLAQDQWQEMRILWVTSMAKIPGSTTMAETSTWWWTNRSLTRMATSQRTTSRNAPFPRQHLKASLDKRVSKMHHSNKTTQSSCEADWISVALKRLIKSNLL